MSAQADRYRALERVVTGFDGLIAQELLSAEAADVLLGELTAVLQRQAGGSVQEGGLSRACRVARSEARRTAGPCADHWRTNEVAVNVVIDDQETRTALMDLWAAKQLKRWVPSDEQDEAYRRARKDAISLALTRWDTGGNAKLIEVLEDVLRVDPDCVPALRLLVVALNCQGRHAEMLECYRRAVTLTPDDEELRASLLYALHYSPGSSRAEVLAQTREWSARHAASLASHWRPHTSSRDPGRRLRVGYVSADFHSHPVAFFIEGVLRAHDREQG